MKHPTALIADDEPALRDYLKNMLLRIWPELEIVAEAPNGQEALDVLRTKNPDIAFLDIHMPGLNGLDVARRLDQGIHIVFITAYDQYAVNAFENAAVDYVLKPVTEERLEVTVERLRSRLSHPPQDISRLLGELLDQSKEKNYLQWIKVSSKDDVQLVAIDEIDYFEAADKYTSAYSAGKEWVIRLSLQSLQERLDPNRFWRIHRSILVRVAAIKRYRKTFSGRHIVELHDFSKKLPVSRRYIALFKPN